MAAVFKPASGTAPRRTGRRSSAAEVHVRQWMARELHDTAAQGLQRMLMDMERVKAEQVGRSEIVEEIDKLQESTRAVLGDLRRSLHALRAEDQGARQLTEWLPALVSNFQTQTGIEARVVGARSWPSPLSTHAAINVCRIVEEALRNVLLYSRARRVLVSLSCSDRIARLRIRDDGRSGFDNRTTVEGMGTLGMRERARLLGGELRIVSS